jgi:hypothetical protein
MDVIAPGELAATRVGVVRQVLCDTGLGPALAIGGNRSDQLSPP